MRYCVYIDSGYVASLVYYGIAWVLLSFSVPDSAAESLSRVGRDCARICASAGTPLFTLGLSSRLTQSAFSEKGGSGASDPPRRGAEPGASGANDRPPTRGLGGQTPQTPCGGAEVKAPSRGSQTESRGDGGTPPG